MNVAILVIFGILLSILALVFLILLLILILSNKYKAFAIRRIELKHKQGLLNQYYYGKARIKITDITPKFFEVKIEAFSDVDVEIKKYYTLTREYNKHIEQWSHVEVVMVLDKKIWKGMSWEQLQLSQGNEHNVVEIGEEV